MGYKIGSCKGCAARREAIAVKANEIKAIVRRVVRTSKEKK